MRRIIMALAILALSTALAHTGEAKATFVDPAGSYRVTVTIRSHVGDIGAEHFDSIKFSIPARRETQEQVLKMTSESAAKLPSRGNPKVRGVQEPDGSFTVDWSQTQVKVSIEQVSACLVGIAGEFTGLVTRNESVFVNVFDAMANLSVVSNLKKKSDSDLFVYDSFGNLVCYSQQPKSTKIPDQCGFLSSTCDQTDDSIVEVFGFNKKNYFHLAIWFANAI